MIRNLQTFSTGIALTPGESTYPYLWKGLVGMWCPSVGKQGNNLLDLSLYNRPGTLNNMDSADYIAGINGYALNYDGIDDFTDIGNIAEINDATQNLSISMWTRTTGGVSNCFWYYDNNNSLSPSSDFYLIQPSNLQIGGIGQNSQIASGISVNDGLWHHIVVVLKDTSLILYKDGIPVFTTTVSHSRANYPTSHNFRIADNANVQFFSGDIGDTLVYNRALEQSEVIDLFNNRTPLVSSIILGAKRGIASQEETETLQISDSIIVTDTIAKEAENLLITDSIIVQDTTIQQADSLQISDSIIVTDTNIDAKFISKIISINPLIFITDTNPVEIIKVDTTDPSNITWIVQTISGITSAKDVAVNTSNNFIYIAGNTGQVIKVEIADFTNQTIIDVSDVDDLITIETNSNFGITYAGTENTVGELYVIDERDIFSIDSDFQVIAPIEFLMESDFNIIDTFKMDSDFRVLAQQTFLISSDFKCITKPIVAPPPTVNPLDVIEPIKLTDFQVFINGIELEDTDLVLDSISITHSESEQSRASFRLTRKHDQLNTTLKGISSQITNQNTVEIKIRGISEFNGNISELDCQYNIEEFIVVNVLSPEKLNQFNNITLSLPSLDSRLSLYDILIENPKIFNPFIDPDNEDNPKKFKGIRVNLGQIITQQVTIFTASDIPFIGDNVSEDRPGGFAQAITDGSFIPIQNSTYFWGAIIARKIGEVKLGKTVEQSFSYIGTSLAPVSEELWQLIGASHQRQRIYSDEIIKLGDGTVAVSDFNNLVDNPLSVHLQLQSRGFLLGSVITNKFKKTTDSSELELTDITGNEQNAIYEEIEKQLGFTVGEAPFEDISVRNGIFVTKPKLVDEPDSLLSIKEAGNNFVEFAKEIARLEFENLKNINGDILPDTSCTFNLTVDAYHYYDISLLTKINIDNTTDVNIYNNANGFPVSVKSITITSADRRVTINADNIKSTKELEEINGQFPSEDNDEYNEKERRILISLKSNMKTGLNVE